MFDFEKSITFFSQENNMTFLLRQASQPYEYVVTQKNNDVRGHIFLFLKKGGQKHK